MSSCRFGTLQAKRASDQSHAISIKGVTAFSWSLTLLKGRVLKTSRTSGFGRLETIHPHRLSFTLSATSQTWKKIEKSRSRRHLSSLENNNSHITLRLQLRRARMFTKYSRHSPSTSTCSMKTTWIAS